MTNDVNDGEEGVLLVVVSMMLTKFSALKIPIVFTAFNFSQSSVRFINLHKNPIKLMQFPGQIVSIFKSLEENLNKVTWVK